MPYKKGHSGNPNGRPRGISARRTELRESLAPHTMDIIHKAISLAKDGDTTALRLCLDRLLPPVRVKVETLELGQLTGTLAGWGQAIVEASLTGKITPNQASALMQALMAQVRLVEADELASRLDAIERQVNRTK
jgi:hypothetical protein